MQNNIDQTMVKNNWMEVGEKRVISFSKVALPYGWLGVPCRDNRDESGAIDFTIIAGNLERGPVGM